MTLESTTFCVGEGFGCTDATACNYDADAELDNGVCDFSCYGCTDPESCNYDADATLDDGSCIGAGIPVTVSVTTDTWPEETTWTLARTPRARSCSQAVRTPSGTTDEQSICLGDGCYTFERTASATASSPRLGTP